MKDRWSDIMSRVTLGKLVVQTARGVQKERSVSIQEIQEVNRDISERVTPKIEQIRDNQRRALEELKPVAVV
jgi:hypothetical protein